ncbi:MAG: RNA polymerase sigma factor [Bacteroidota bacterium]
MLEDATQDFFSCLVTYAILKSSYGQMTPQEYNKCVELYADRVYRFILKNIRHDYDAHDIVQNAFEILWVRHTQVEFSKARSYLFTTAYNNMIDIIRKVKRMEYVEQVPEGYTGSFTSNFEHKQLIDLAVERLNPVHRSVLLLRDYEGYSYKEIGEMTNLTESQVKVYIFRARKKMKEILSGELTETNGNGGRRSKSS